MQNEIRVFKNEDLDVQVRTIANPDGSISISAEDTAIGFGWSRIEKKNGKEYLSIMWARMNGFCKEIGFAHECAKGDFIPESVFYRLGMKANNAVADKFQNWLAIDVIPALRKTGSYEMPKKKEKPDRTEIMLMNARSRMAQTYLKLANVDTLSSTYKTILVAKASQVLSGEELIPLPESKRKVYSAGEIGEMFGISANKVGRIANKHNLKTDQFGEYRRSKSEHSAKEIDTWVYFDTVIPVIEKILGQEVA